MTRAVSVVEVAEPSVWEELAARAPIEAHLGEALSPTRRIALPSFEKELQPRLDLLVRYPRRETPEEVRTELAGRVAALPEDARRVLAQAQHHALDGVVLARHAWDPVEDAGAVRALYGAGLLEPVDDARYRLDPDLPPPPQVSYDFSDALMEETCDLEPPRPGPVGLLHDVASFAAAIEHTSPRRTVTGAIAKPDARRLAARLGVADLDDERWARALRGLEALHVVSTDPLQRTIHLDLGLEATLAGDAPDAVDALLHRLVEPDLHGVVPAVRAALRQAGHGAVDEVVFLDVLREQHRDVIFPPWRRGGALVYPQVGDERARPYDDATFEAVEVPMIRALLARLGRLGLLRRAPGVLAATADGRIWAGAAQLAAPPIWVTSDLELVVAPNAVTPWERFQLERLGRCLSRDVVDRYRLERRGLETWLRTHDVEEALALLRRRCPGVPNTVVDSLATWARAATRAVLWRGVLVD